MQLTGTQRSAIYFKRHKRSKCRAALFRQLRATLENQTRDVKQNTGDNVHPAGVSTGTIVPTGFGILEGER